MKKITVISGSYGSGKSEFSLNLAINKNYKYLVDLDVINPYFRSRELEELLNKYQIKTIASPLKNARGSDLPFISSEAYLPFSVNEKTIIDLGGDVAGAKLMRQFEDLITDDVELLVCVNIYRESTQTVESIISSIRKLEGSSGLVAKGLINTSNLLKETTIEDILKGQEILLEVSKALNIPIVYSALPYFLTKDSKLKGEVIPINLYLRPTWL